jgi:hypothetical protein
LQPLDKTFFGPLKSYYNRACDQYFVSNPNKRITPYDVALLFAEAYGKTATSARRRRIPPPMNVRRRRPLSGSAAAENFDAAAEFLSAAFFGGRTTNR